MIWWLAVVGGLGACARFIVDGFIASRHPLTIPLGTLVINLSGSLILGILTGWAVYGGGGHAAELRTVLGTGFCGGFTTFSTASVESVRLTFAQGPRAGVGYAGVTLVGACVAAAIGMVLGSVL